MRSRNPGDNRLVYRFIDEVDQATSIQRANGVTQMISKKFGAVAAALAASVLAAAMGCEAGAKSGARMAASDARPKPAVVLVHGAFADGSAWQDVIVRLQRDGFVATAVQNPLFSF